MQDNDTRHEWSTKIATAHQPSPFYFRRSSWRFFLRAIIAACAFLIAIRIAPDNDVAES
jgi:hypothetical protein